MEAQMVKQGASLEMKRIFQAPLTLVYRAWTEPEMMNGWFHPEPTTRSVCTVDLRVNGRYEIQMHPQKGGPYVVGGVYQEIVPREKLVFTWRWQGDEVDDEETLVTILFRALSDSAMELTIKHAKFSSDEARDNHASGWQGVLEQLAAALA